MLLDMMLVVRARNLGNRGTDAALRGMLGKILVLVLRAIRGRR